MSKAERKRQKARLKELKSGSAVTRKHIPIPPNKMEPDLKKKLNKRKCRGKVEY
jgi:hypothetical protein